MRVVRFKGWIVLCVSLMLVFGTTTLMARQGAKSSNARTHTYYIAADEVEWDYAPSGIDQMTGQPFGPAAKIFIEGGPNRIGKVYRKAIYREYTDGTISTLKPRPPQWEHLGILGPLLRGEVGDTIHVVFKNNASRPYSMHPHGVFYTKSSEGVPYNDGTSGADKKDDAVPPGGTHTYVWPVPERAGPGPNDPSSLVWFYHSHVNEPKDVMSGLVGAMIINARGTSKADGTPKDVDREFIGLFMVFDENMSWYFDHNIETYAGDPKSVNKAEAIFLDVDGNFSFVGSGFANVNFKYAINGRLFGNLPVMEMKQGERVRWYLLSLGDFVNMRTPHWHGNVVLEDKKRRDVVFVGPAMMLTVDMIPDNPGTWMFHCHVSDHLASGMMTRYRVVP